MFLVFTLLLLSLGVGLFLNVYASFFPFLQSISTISDYNAAYYSALSAVERGSLVLRYKEAGFQGSGGMLAGTGRGPLSDQRLFFISGDQQGNRWTISSRTKSIPGVGEGNIDPFLLAPDSTNYNAIRYHSLETFLLSMDNTTSGEQYYSGTSSPIIYFTGGFLSGEFRLPSAVANVFSSGGNSLLCADASGPCDTDEDGVYDEIVMNRGLQGTYNTTPFKIIPTIGIFPYSGMHVNEFLDNALRASVINNSGAIVMGDGNHTFTLLDNGDSLQKHTIVSQDTSIQTKNFGTILGGGPFWNLQLTFSIISLLRTYEGSVYPYLEYRFTFPQEISDRFYKLVGHGRNREYDVQILIKKPTVEGTVGGDFTVIF